MPPAQNFSKRVGHPVAARQAMPRLRHVMGWHTFLNILSATLEGRKVRTRKEYMVLNSMRYGVDLNNLAR